MSYPFECDFAQPALMEVARRKAAVSKALRHFVRPVRLCDFPHHIPNVKK